MAKPVSAVPNIFANATTTIPLSQLDADFTSLVNAMNDLANSNNFAIDSGTANAIVLNFPAGITTNSLTTGLSLEFQCSNDNTGAATLLLQVNSSSIGTAKNIVNEDAWRSVHSSVSRAASNIDNINRNMGLFAEKEL